jgi:hypothetical protein
MEPHSKDGVFLGTALHILAKMGRKTKPACTPGQRYWRPVVSERKTMSWSFTKHPQDVGETYTEHFGVAMRFSGAMIAGGLACAVHAVLPFCFTTTGSSTIRRLNERMVLARNTHSAAPAALAEPRHT